MSGDLHTAGDEIGGRYVIDGYIGQGGMQEVYEARDTLLDRTVALKSPKGPSAKKRFKRSAVVSARVNHANVAKTLDYLEDGDRPYLIEELVRGCNLAEFQRLYVRALDPYSVARVFHHLSKGLQASHHAHVIHRDLKPSNVMVLGGQTFSDVKITDFGIAKLAEDEIEQAVAGGGDALTASATALGALPYMSPEMIDDPKDVKKPADVWALGAMTYELLTGTKPFGDGYKAIKKIESDPVPPLAPSISASAQFGPLAIQIQTIVLRCMEKDPSQRLTVDELVEQCGTLCYTEKRRRFGSISSLSYGKHGFITPDDGSDSVFYHVNSGYNLGPIKIGTRVWFSDYDGHPRPRAFPLLKAIDTSPTS